MLAINSEQSATAGTKWTRATFKCKVGSAMHHFYRLATLTWCEAGNRLLYISLWMSCRQCKAKNLRSLESEIVSNCSFSFHKCFSTTCKITSTDLDNCSQWKQTFQVLLLAPFSGIDLQIPCSKTHTHTHYLHEQIAFKLTQHAYVNEIANPVSQKWLRPPRTTEPLRR